jgi:plasmid stabilization system protein ParE
MRMALEALEQTSDWIFKSDQPEAAQRLRQRAIDALRAQIGQIGGGR